MLALPALAGCSSNGQHREVPFGFIGMLIARPTANVSLTERELRAMAASGVEAVRVPLLWREVQPYPSSAAVPPAQRARFHEAGGVPTDLGAYDRLVAAAARSGLSVLPTVLGSPPWARSDPLNIGSPPSQPGPYARLLGVLVRRYREGGEFWRARPNLPARPIHDWQVWNEPSHRLYWSQQPYYTRYLRLLAAARREIKAADPGARVVTAGLVDRSWDQLDTLYRRGGSRLFDVVAIHPFTLKVSNVMRIMRYAREVMRRHGDAGKPILVTELTWPSSKGRLASPSDFDVTEAQQARLLSAGFLRLARARRRLGIERVYWASWLTRDASATDAFDFAGLRELRASGVIRTKPAYFAFRRVARRLEDCVKTTVATRCR
jgi:hypothetical protein